MTPALTPPRAPFRRRRPLLFLAAVIVTLTLLLRGAALHPSLGGTRLSGGKIVDYFRLKPRIDEIYGLIHVVAAGDDKHHVLYHEVADATVSIDFSTYADGKNISWESEVERLNSYHPLVVFSEVYCPYSRRAMKVLSEYDITPNPLVVELDTREDGDIIKTILTRLTGRVALPNIFVRGTSIGGWDELLTLYKSKRFERVLQDAGAVVKKRT